jgi:lipoprotein-anchoring transpeptidase ErfK/SrfK
MEQLFADESARWVRFRPSAEIVRTAARLTTAAAAAESSAVARGSRQLLDARRRREELAERLHAIRARVDAQPGAKRLRVAYRRAEVALGAVRVLEKEGRPASLAAQLDSAAVAVARAETLLDLRMVRLYDADLQRRWQSWVDATVSESGSRQPAILIDKLRRRCVVVRDGGVVARFPAEFGRNGFLDKLHAGDGATPEGRYKVTHKNKGSRYHLALLLDYPNAADKAEHAQARRQGRVREGVGPGGLIEIHGHGGTATDWTDGCIALRDEDIEQLFGLAAVGTPVTIVGSARFPGD